MSLTADPQNMPTSKKPQFEEKRFALRMALRLPIVVSGRAEDGVVGGEERLARDELPLADEDVGRGRQRVVAEVAGPRRAVGLRRRGRQCAGIGERRMLRPGAGRR